MTTVSWNEIQSDQDLVNQITPNLVSDTGEIKCNPNISPVELPEDYKRPAYISLNEVDGFLQLKRDLSRAEIYIKNKDGKTTEITEGSLDKQLKALTPIARNHLLKNYTQRAVGDDVIAVLSRNLNKHGLALPGTTGKQIKTKIVFNFDDNKVTANVSVSNINLQDIESESESDETASLAGDIRFNIRYEVDGSYYSPVQCSIMVARLLKNDSSLTKEQVLKLAEGKSIKEQYADLFTDIKSFFPRQIKLGASYILSILSAVVKFISDGFKATAEMRQGKIKTESKSADTAPVPVPEKRIIKADADLSQISIELNEAQANDQTTNDAIQKLINDVAVKIKLYNNIPQVTLKKLPLELIITTIRDDKNGFQKLNNEQKIAFLNDINKEIKLDISMGEINNNADAFKMSGEVLQRAADRQQEQKGNMHQPSMPVPSQSPEEKALNAIEDYLNAAREATHTEVENPSTNSLEAKKNTALKLARYAGLPITESQLNILVNAKNLNVNFNVRHYIDQLQKMPAATSAALVSAASTASTTPTTTPTPTGSHNTANLNQSNNKPHGLKT